jgi:hypothetical protein
MERKADELPAARIVPRERLARLRASAAHAARALRRAWSRVAQQVLILSLTALGFAGVLAMTFVLAQQAITVHAITEPPPSAPMVIYFMRQPQAPRATHAAIQAMHSAQQEIDPALNCECY